MLSNNTEEEFKLRTIFKQFDLNQSGGISVIELAALLAKLGVLVDNKYIEAMFKQIDTNNNGIIEFSEFANLVIYNPYK
jgi:Ca2+-binding EF-hand superfamily protein